MGLILIRSLLMVCLFASRILIDKMYSELACMNSKKYHVLTFDLFGVQKAVGKPPSNSS
jgi:hypothetical protein